ncbi:lipopolysaccharide transport periplasmic protein LptA [Thalassotalea sp. LPB0316]|uniref:lipopolysaccharide transport periplasmic protein LptA n=1 Tax=Thalassotalea sp. LPB0316 TaxID=2769490 RepID=UPI00186760C4|nr:lipopolysaccharide transport periplasmic protein LptA [Thalassotalea sp. LPB0316]QOL26899.1 lipopolysaccharide transport periplasmic protein LptA [Thalassotalea sp. LPB0316]
MYKQFIEKSHHKSLTVAPIALLAMLLCTAPSAFAKKSDLQEEILISADRTAGDLKNRIASYIDDVIITQGSLKIHAELVQVIEDEASDSETYIAKGSPAIFEQLLEDGTPIKLEANEITYEPSINTITISGNAKLSQEGSEVNGDKIIYNTLTEQLEAKSKPKERITTILKPKTKDEVKDN